MTEISSEIYMRCGSKNRTKLISINKIASSLGKEVCASLIGFHAYTGCDTVSAFSGQGKLKGIKLVCQNKDFQEAFTELGTHWSLNQKVYKTLQEFTCNLYATRSTICEVNKLRYHLWRAKKGAVESSQLPPCEDSLNIHTMRANYQSAVWKRSLISNPNIPSPESHGWILADDGKLEIQWMAGLPAPSVILEFISCKCNRKCQLPSCECMVSGLKCTDECKLQNCTNMSDVHDDSDEFSQDNFVTDAESSEDEGEHEF